MTQALVKTRHKFLRRYPVNGVYFLWFKFHGHRHQFSLGTAIESLALEIAQDKIREIKAQAATGQPQTPGHITLDALLNHFLEVQRGQVQKKTLKQTSFDAIEDGVKKIRRDQPAWLALPAAKLTFEKLDQYVTTVIQAKSPTTVNKVVDAFKRAYLQGLADHLLSANPAARLARASTHAVKADEIPTEEQYHQLIEHFRQSKLSHKWHVIDLVEFLSNFGTRIKEARNILKTDVDLGRRQIAIYGDPDPAIGTKNRKMRVLPIFDHALPLIQRLLARKNLRIYGKEVRCDFLLAIGKCYGAINSAARKLGIPVHGHHTFRHLCATRWIEQGVNIKHVAKWLGHQDGGKLALTIYTKARDEQDRHEAAKVKGTLHTIQPASKKIVPLAAADPGTHDSQSSPLLKPGRVAPR
jgi:integrase